MPTDHPGSIEEPISERDRAIRSYEYAKERVWLTQQALREAETDLQQAQERLQGLQEVTR